MLPMAVEAGNGGSGGGHQGERLGLGLSWQE